MSPLEAYEGLGTGLMLTSGPNPSWRHVRRGVSLRMRQQSRGRPYLHSVLQGPLWIHDLPPDGGVRGFEFMILFLVRMVDDVSGNRQQCLQRFISPHRFRRTTKTEQNLTLMAS